MYECLYMEMCLLKKMTTEAIGITSSKDGFTYGFEPPPDGLGSKAGLFYKSGI